VWQYMSTSSSTENLLDSPFLSTIYSLTKIIWSGPHQLVLNWQLVDRKDSSKRYYFEDFVDIYVQTCRC
jgi:hypothetical protein